MTWTYDAQVLSSASNLSVSMTRVRLMIGDTIAANPQLQDEEITYILTVQPVLTYAAADCCDLLSAKYAFQVNTENSELAVAAAARHKHFAELAGRLRRAGPGDSPGGFGAGQTLGGTYAGGISNTANSTLEGNSDNVLPPFRVGQDDFYSDNPLDPIEYFSDE